jgi:murein DD-endopeptidase MepM/ murein hydrolase activator NlpD
MGSTGYSTGAHTHIELRPKGTSRDSLDIAAFTGIPNKVGTYEYKENVNTAVTKTGKTIIANLHNSMKTILNKLRKK